ncbi:S-adenosyl-L-methionine-dependent methyltransferase [Parachaetomium inaequale]|uniref:S-adenosyl-L-methionine-dependent methyltransferase n=1 Tax=Parachaetomium inaequale TaxID=2588326 RepID=A0AAN6PN35_9PEZI|nr:S-adenosyl-L-methionine-dependent methyltransferase [Parachaetomium inaequale]
MPAAFEKQSYWHDRFASETSFEWLTSSAAFMDVLTPYLQHIPNSAQILHLGSGTSDLQNHLRRWGFLNVTNIDYEPLALERGQQLESNQFGDVRTKYLVVDATRLELEEKFQVAIDKSTADAIACGEEDAVSSMAKGIWRCLDDDGFWFSLSYSAWRFEHVQDLFEVEVISKVPTPRQKPTDPDIFHYCYLLRPRRQFPGQVCRGAQTSS